MNAKKKHQAISGVERPIEFVIDDLTSHDDIYSNNQRVLLSELQSDIDTDEPSVQPTPLGADLDVPGAELDDPNEKIGDEDEENNYYSLGGDNHDDLEESTGHD